MMKRSFFALSKPRLTYDLLEPDLSEPQTILVPDLLTLLLPEPIDDRKKALIRTSDPVTKGQKLLLYQDSTAYCVSPVSGTIKSIGTFSGDFGPLRTFITIEKNAGTALETTSLDISEDLAFAAGHLLKLPVRLPLISWLMKILP